MANSQTGWHCFQLNSSLFPTAFFSTKKRTSHIRSSEQCPKQTTRWSFLSRITGSSQRAVWLNGIPRRCSFQLWWKEPMPVNLLQLDRFAQKLIAERIGFATRLVSLMLLGTFCLGFYQKLFIHRLNLTGSTAENSSLHKSRHCIRSAGSPKQWWWRLTSTIDRNWSLTRDLAVPWLHIQSSTCDWVARTWARETFLILTESPPFHEQWRQRFTPCLR